MGIWVLIIFGVLAGLFFGTLFISFRASRFPFIQKAAGGRKWLSVLIAFILFASVGVILSLAINVINTFIVLLHLTAFWLLSELLFLILRKSTGRQISGYMAGVCAVIFTAVYMTIAWYQCTHVWEKDYALESTKLQGSLRVVQITDSHMGSTFHAAGFLEYIHQINELHPDIVVITGDFVDDSTTKEDLVGSCQALGELETTYGVFFAYGNHDKGYFSDRSRGWNNDVLLENLEGNGVVVLQDEVELIDDRFYIIGRQDKSEEMRGGGRKTPEELMADLDPDLYKIVLDHQPCEYDEEAAAGANLVLSGHTHGGQFFPFNQAGVLTRQYERSYGHERRGETDYIVSSGISDWTLIFKTGCRSEYVVVDIN